MAAHLLSSPAERTKAPLLLQPTDSSPSASHSLASGAEIEPVCVQCVFAEPAMQRRYDLASTRQAGPTPCCPTKSRLSAHSVRQVDRKPGVQASALAQ